MRLSITFILSVVLLSAFAQKRANRIVIGTVDTVYSNILKGKRPIFIHVPNSDKNQRYPVLYILDGGSHFQSAVAIVQQMTGVIPDMIVVGIVNTVRERDLTPTHVSNDNESGGGEAFLKFFAKELIPYIDSKYPTAPYRVLSGHSLGGLTVVDAFINHSALFNAYIAIDPSLWWDGQKWIKQAETNLSQANVSNRGKSLFVAIANNIPAGMDTISVMKDTSAISLIPRAVLPFIHWLKEKQLKGLRWSYKFYPDERHGSVELIAEYDALRYLFNYYQFDDIQFDGHPELNVDSVLTAHFNLVSGKLGYKVLPSEHLINNLGYYFLNTNKLDNAYPLFKRNTINYPQNASAWDSLGDYYVATGDKQKAIEAFKKSLSLQETADSREKLNQQLTKK